MMREFLEQYEGVACTAVTQDDDDIGTFNMTPKHVALTACTLLGREELNLFEKADYPAIYESDDMPTILGGGMLACLRLYMFELAKAQKVGNQEFNEMMVADSAMWQRKLLEKWAALRDGSEARHAWMN